MVNEARKELAHNYARKAKTMLDLSKMAEELPAPTVAANTKNLADKYITYSRRAIGADPMPSTNPPRVIPKRKAR